MATTQPIRDKKQVKEILQYYHRKKQWRNYVLIALGLYTALRISDLLTLTWDSVYDFHGKQFRSHICITEKKTGKAKAIALNAEALEILRQYFCVYKQVEKDNFLFASKRKFKTPISRIQAWRIIREAAEAVGLEGTISCHSLRKTFGYHAWKTGAPPVVIMDIFNHSSFEITRRYLGICQDDRDTVYNKMQFLIS